MDSYIGNSVQDGRYRTNKKVLLKTKDVYYGWVTRKEG